MWSRLPLAEGDCRCRGSGQRFRPSWLDMRNSVSVFGLRRPRSKRAARCRPPLCAPAPPGLALAPDFGRRDDEQHLGDAPHEHFEGFRVYRFGGRLCCVRHSMPLVNTFDAKYTLPRRREVDYSGRHGEEISDHRSAHLSRQGGPHSHCDG